MNYPSHLATVVRLGACVLVLSLGLPAHAAPKGDAAQVDIFIEQVGAGTVTTIPEGPYLPGTEVTLTAVPDEGWYFFGWSDYVDVPLSVVTTVTVEEDTTVACSFRPLDGMEDDDAYMLVAFVTFGGRIERTPGGTGFYTPNTRVQVTAVADPGFTFLRWGGEVEDDTARATFVTVDEPKYVSVAFVPTGFEGEWPFEGEGCIEGCEGEDCFAACEDAEADRDGDGLTDCFENCIGTDWDDPDTDRDGMPDGWEWLFGVNPLVANALDDLDGDSTLNIDEYLGGSNPFNVLDPVRVRYVSTTGVDDIEGGGVDAPWRTIRYAMSRASVLDIGRIEVAGGRYDEDVTLEPGVVLSGPDSRLELDGAMPAIIRGEVIGAEGAVLEDITVESPASGAVLLTMNQAAMNVTGCTFNGGGMGNVTGLLTMGAQPGAGLVEDCDFISLRYGMDIGDFNPTLRLSRFQDSSAAHIRFRAGGRNEGGSLGADGESDTGWNRFFPMAGVPSIVNERAESIKIERNDWDTDDAAAIDAVISGPADFQPFLPAGSALLAGSLFCSVFDADDQNPILDASVSLQPVTANPVTENVDGVYAFPAIPGDMSYTVRVDADGFEPLAMPIMLSPGELKTVNFPLGRGPVNPPPGGCQCADPGKAAPVEAYTGNLLIGAILILALATRRRKP